MVDSEHVVEEASNAVGVTEGALVTMASGESDEEYRDTWGSDDPMPRRRHDGGGWESSRHEEVKRFHDYRVNVSLFLLRGRFCWALSVPYIIVG